MEFHIGEEKFTRCISFREGRPLECNSDFDSLFQSRWTNAAEAGICRYRLTNLQTKILPGKFNLVAQLNAERATQRRLPQDLQKVNSPFDPSQFNFNKVPQQEILVKLVRTDDDKDNIVVINISPLEFGNSLLVPNVTKNIPQRVTLEGVDLLVRVMLLSSNVNFKAGFNSPGGYASVNHQHYHLYYLQERLYLESVDVEPIAGPCFALTNFPSKGFAFQLDDDPSLLAKNVFTLVNFLNTHEIAYNLFLTRGKRFGQSRSDVYDTIRVFVWAREPTFGVKEEVGFNPALCELAGHLLIKEPAAFEAVTEKEVVELLEGITVPWFEQVRIEVPNLFPNA